MVSLTSAFVYDFGRGFDNSALASASVYGFGIGFHDSVVASASGIGFGDSAFGFCICLRQWHWFR